MCYTQNIYLVSIHVLYIYIYIYISCLECLALGFLYTNKKRSLGSFSTQKGENFVVAFSHGERHHVWLMVYLVSHWWNPRFRSTRRRCLQEEASRLERGRVEEVIHMSCNCKTILSGLKARGIPGFFPLWVFPRTSRRSD